MCCGEKVAESCVSLKKNKNTDTKPSLHFISWLLHGMCVHNIDIHQIGTKDFMYKLYKLISDIVFF